jgi:D-alanyl-D-alanine carboxypeptidase/D-alanyl-D-alanine-endopeptidase (penicillin-binding protein 4)
LQSRINEILQKPELAPAMVGIKVASLDTGRVLFAENAHKLLRPASNMKLYTVSTALDRLSPDFHFSTSVYANSKPDEAGTVHGSLTIYGRGDPSIAARFNDGDYFQGINDLAARIAAAGVKKIDGDLVGDESYFTGPQYGAGWEWEDLTWYYGAEVSALTVNDNALDLFVKPGNGIGAPALVTTGPPDPLLTIVNHVTTAPKKTKRNLTVARGLGANTLEVSGFIALDDAGYTGGVGISHPALLFVYLLRAALVQKGITITGRSRTETATQFESVSYNTEGHLLTHGRVAPLRGNIEIASLQSPPFSVVAAKTLKPSQNLYTELILRTLGNKLSESAPQNSRTSEEAGVIAVKSFLKQAGVNPATLVLTDGSGLSRNDMVTAEATVQLLTYMSKQKYAAVWRDALPIAGVDGTLRTRMRGTVAENNLRAKTGSLSSAASLSGYVTTAAGENLVFSIMVNNYPEDVEPRTVCIDPIAVLVASFAGRSL